MPQYMSTKCQRLGNTWILKDTWGTLPDTQTSLAGLKSDTEPLVFYESIGTSTWFFRFSELFITRTQWNPVQLLVESDLKTALWDRKILFTCIYKWILGSQIRLICAKNVFTSEFDLAYNLTINVLETQRKTKPNHFACIYSIVTVEFRRTRLSEYCSKNHQSKKPISVESACLEARHTKQKQQQSLPCLHQTTRSSRLGWSQLSISVQAAGVGHTDLSALADHFLCWELREASWALLGKRPFERKDGKRCSFSGKKEI